MIHTADQITLYICPFEDLSPSSELGPYGRSLVQDLLTELSRFRQFRVLSFRSSNHAHLAANLAFPESDYYVEGTLSYDGDPVRINVQLCQGQTHHLIWGHRFEGQRTSLNSMQNDLLTALVGVLQQQINTDLLGSLRKRPVVAYSAYEHWLQGMELIRHGSPKADLKARKHFEEALAVQPDYALACTGMSLTYFNEWSCQLWDHWDRNKNGAFEWAQKAIALDDQNYLAAMVLGKIYLYENAWETAEYYLRQSLSLNPNDPDSILNIACYLVFLGHHAEAGQWYERALRLNPHHTGKYMPYGAFIYFEMGQFEKASTMIMQLSPSKWADAEAYYAATYYYLNDFDNMQRCWQQFLATYTRLIAKTTAFDVQEAIEWIRLVNPHKHPNSRLEGFLQHISRSNHETPVISLQPQQRPAPGTYYFCKEGDHWKMAFEGMEVMLPEVKGFYDIARLLAQPNRAVYSTELMGAGLELASVQLIDEKAKAEYRQRLKQLQMQIKEAEEEGAWQKMERLQMEYDQLVAHLSASLNHRGQARQTNATAEKARAAVTWRIRHAIARIEAKHQRLGRHLANAIKTGSACAYHPDRDIEWVVETATYQPGLTM